MASDAQQPKRRWRRVLGSAAALLAILAVAGGWLLGTASGARAAFSLLTALTSHSVQADGVEGRLAGPLRLDRLTLDTQGQKIILDDLRLDWRPSALARGELHILSLRAAEMDLTLKPSDEPVTMPQSLALPLRLRADEVAMRRGTIRSGDTPVATLGETALTLAYDGSAYRLHLAQLGAQASGAQGPVSASLRGDATLDAHAPFALQATLASGAEAALGGQPLNASGQIRLGGTLADIRLASDLTLGQASLTGSAVLRPFAPQVLGPASLGAQGIDLAVLRSDLPQTRLSLALEVQEDGSGRLTADNAEAGTYDDKRLPVSRLLLAFRQGEGKTLLDDILLALGTQREPAGEIAGKGEMEAGNAHLSLTLQGVDLRRLDRRAQVTRLAGHAELRQQEGRQEFSLDLDQPLQKKRLALAAHALLADEVLTLDRFAVRLGEGSVEGKARVALGGTQDFSAEGRFSKFQPKDLGNFANLPDLLLNGDFSAQGARQPTLAARLHFDIRDSRLAGQPLQGEGRGELRNGILDIARLVLNAGPNRLNVEGRLADERSNLVFSLRAPQLDMLGAGFGGAVELDGTASGTLEAPRIQAQWRGNQVRLPQALQFDTTQGNATLRLNRARPLMLETAKVETEVRGVRNGDRQIESVTLKGQFSPQPNAPLDVVLNMRGIRVGNAAADSIDVTAQGSAGAHTLQAVLAAPNQSLTLGAAGGLSRLDSAPQWQGSLQRLDAAGSLTSRLARPAPLLVSARRTQLDGFRLESNAGTIDMEQFVRDPLEMITRGRIEQFQPARLLAFAGPEAAVSTDLVLSGEWNLRFGDNLNGYLRMRRDSGDVVMRGNSQVALQLRELRADATAADGRITVQGRLEGARAGTIVADVQTGVVRNGGQVSLSPDAPLSGSIRGDLPSIGWLAGLASPDFLAEGSLRANVRLSGTMAQPDLAGRIDGRTLRFLHVRTGVDLRDGVLDGEFQGSRLRIHALRFGPQGKDLTASGQVDFAEGKPSARFMLRADEFALFDRSDRRIIVSGNSDIAWSENTARVSGNFRTESGFIDITSTGMPQLADDVVIVGKTKAEPGQRGLPAHIDVGIALGRGITLKGRGLDARLGGDIRLQSEPGEPLRARGTLQVTRGTFTAYGRELAIERGVLRFNGPIDNPALDILAMRRGQTVEAGVNVLGTVLSPRVVLVSEPSVPDAEKLSWLVLGQGLNESGGGDVAALQAAAGSLLTRGAASGVQSQLAQAFGLDEIKVGTDSESTLQEHIVTLGKRISSRLYVSVEQGIESATSVLRLRYTLSRRLTVEAGAGTRSTLLLFYNIAYD